MNLHGSRLFEDVVKRGCFVLWHPGSSHMALSMGLLCQLYPKCISVLNDPRVVCADFQCTVS